MIEVMSGRHTRCERDDDTGGRPVVVARQAILDRREEVIGFEVLYRPLASDSVLPSAEVATSQVVVQALADIGLERLTGDQHAYINVSADLLLHERPLPLPPHRVILEVLEDQRVDAGLIEVLHELIGAGFTIALDDFQLGAGADDLLELASVVKLDVRALDRKGLVDHVDRLREHEVSLIAEKVETRDEYEFCRALGFNAFQGYFFAKPDIVEGRAAPTHRLGALTRLADSSQMATFEQLERLIIEDAGISAKLLRLANSAFIPSRRQVASVHEALTLLGTVAVRRWVMMLALAGVTDRPHHLLTTALQRARVCELLAGRQPRLADGDRAFTAGLFSTVDALLATPMTAVLDELAFDDRMSGALLSQDGPEGRLLASVLAYERGDFHACREPGIELDAFSQAYRKALEWADDITSTLAS